MPGSLLILTGPPGAGKSAVARSITGQAPRPAVGGRSAERRRARVVGPWALQPFRDAAKRDRLDLFYVVLRPT